MKKFSAEPFFLAVVALAVLPLQQIFLKNAAKHPPVKPPVEMPEQDWSSSALSGNAGGVMKMVFFNLQRNVPQAADAWLNFGSMNLQAPSVMLFYGDWLKQQGKVRRAEYFYRYALRKAKKNNAPQNFIRELEKRLGGKL